MPGFGSAPSCYVALKSAVFPLKLCCGLRHAFNHHSDALGVLLLKDFSKRDIVADVKISGLIIGS
eukprot:3528436-Amphidinium_carterae.1